MPTDGDCTAEGRTGEDAHGARHPKKSGGVFCEGVAVRYAFIERHEQVWPITTQCRVLAVSASGYHQHRARSEAPDQPGRIRDMALLVHIRAVFIEMKGAYGWPRIWREFGARGIHVGKERVRKLMKAYGLQARGKRKFNIFTPNKPRRLSVFASCIVTSAKDHPGNSLTIAGS